MTPRPDARPPAPLSPADLRRRIGPVLADLSFPALRWQAVTAGDLYGCDGVTRSLLQRLPERRYVSLAELIGVLAAVIDPRAVPARADAHLSGVREGRPADGRLPARMPHVRGPREPAPAAPATPLPADPGPTARRSAVSRPR